MPELTTPSRPALLTAARRGGQRSNSVKSSPGNPWSWRRNRPAASLTTKLNTAALIIRSACTTGIRIHRPSQASMQIAVLAARRSSPDGTQTI
jgi:hypothetical protein